MVSTLLGLAASSMGILAADAPAYRVVMNYLLPLVVPLLLFNADLSRILRSTGVMLLAFLAGSAADNIMCAIYFTALFALASKIPPEVASSENVLADSMVDTESRPGKNLPILESAAAVAVSFTICKAGTFITEVFSTQGGNIPCISAIVVALATIFPAQIGKLATAGEPIALIFMQVFFVVVGANGSIWNVIYTTPGVFAFAFVQVAVHLLVILVLGRTLRMERKLLLVASNANIGGPTTACAMATAKGWRSLIVPGVLSGIFGISIATFLGIGFGLFLLRHM
ncbi:hypothetical protein AXF42_Ash006980 [Apostasia shenzhenica]|uniref:Membrane protein YjcL n=1 Tax=Apostasia shenzhenica TaxID=1088818 RepID=A0A2I0BEP7_9ASPA|nr:hypothetical protein AXF42_Ash006980 [Apostasia shenzhenica]